MEAGHAVHFYVCADGFESNHLRTHIGTPFRFICIDWKNGHVASVVCIAGYSFVEVISPLSVGCCFPVK